MARRTRLTAGILAVAVLGLAGCATAQPDDAEALKDACAKITTDAEGVPVCETLHDGDAGLVLPASGSHAYGVFTRGAGSIVAGGDRTLTVSDAVRSSLGDDGAYAHWVYRLQTEGDEVTAVSPAMRIDEDALLEHAFAGRTLVGEISTATGDEEYDLTSYVPVVITVAATANDGAIDATIRNDTTSVSVGGVCRPALTDTAAANPLRGGFTHSLTVQRVPSMHVAFEDELVLAWSDSYSGMGSEFFPSVATLTGHDPLGDIWQIAQHGVPTSGPALSLTLAPRDDTVRSC